MKLPFTKKTRIRVFFAILALGLGIGGGIAYYLITEKFEDTKNVKASHTVSALQFIKEFQENDSLANATYRNRIVELKGKISDIKWPDTVANIIMTAPSSGDYLIFAFQAGDAKEVRSLQIGDSIAVRAECSGGQYSSILKKRSIQFQRATLIQKF